MGFVCIRQKFLLPPQYDAPLNPGWIERGLVVACNPAVGAYNQVARRFATNSGGMASTATETGRSWQGGTSKYVDFSAGYSPGSVGATVLQVVNPGLATDSFSFSSRNSSTDAGIEALIGAGGVAGNGRGRLNGIDTPDGTITGLHDGRDHTLALRYIPSTELRLWKDAFGVSSVRTVGIPASQASTQNLRLHSRSTTYYTGKSGLFLYFNRPLSDADVGSLLQNPYSVYEAPSRRIWTITRASHNLAGAASTQSSAGSAAAITQDHALISAISVQTNAGDTGTVAPGAVALGGTASTQSNAGIAAAIEQAHILVVSASAQVNASAAMAITPVHSLAATDSIQPNSGAADAINISGDFTGTPLTQANLSGTGQITRTQTLSGANSAQANLAGIGAISDGIVVEAALTTGIATTVRIKKPGIPAGTPEWLKTLLEIVIGRRGNAIKVPKFETLTFSAAPTKAECEALYFYTNKVRAAVQNIITRLDS